MPIVFWYIAQSSFLSIEDCGTRNSQANAKEIFLSFSFGTDGRKIQLYYKEFAAAPTRHTKLDMPPYTDRILVGGDPCSKSGLTLQGGGRTKYRWAPIMIV